MVPVEYYFALSAILFILGALGVLIRRNAIIISYPPEWSVELLNHRTILGTGPKTRNILKTGPGCSWAD